MNYDIFSKRGKKPPDVYSYDDIPRTLRVQVLLNVGRAIDLFTLPPSVYEDTADILREEYGVFSLVPHASGDVREVSAFFLNEKNIERVLDVVEMLLKLLHDKWQDDPASAYNYSDDPILNTIVAVNRRFKEHGVGYEFVEDRIVRKDSEYVHEQIVRPALALLQQERFDGARDEFLQAHSDYRKGNNKAAINECLKALESVMKTICDSHRWSYPSNPNSSSLIDTCLNNNLVPTYWQSYFRALESMLKSGVPTGRNRLSGHGQGQQPQSVPDHIVRFVLHQTAACIVFLGECDSRL